MKPVLSRSFAIALAISLALEIPIALFMLGGLLPSEAEARIGRPATPGSVAGVARRTTRRTIRRGAYIAALPRACVRATVYGYAVWNCGGRYYQSSGSGFVVVYF